MTTNRQPIKRPARARITPKAVELFKQGLEELKRTPHEFISSEIQDALAAELGLDTFRYESVFELAAGDEPPATVAPAWRDNWRTVARLRRRLFAAIGEAPRRLQPRPMMVLSGHQVRLIEALAQRVPHARRGQLMALIAAELKGGGNVEDAAVVAATARAVRLLFSNEEAGD